jgi:hypothetical protein
MKNLARFEPCHPDEVRQQRTGLCRHDRQQLLEHVAHILQVVVWRAVQLAHRTLSREIKPPRLEHTVLS